MSTDMHELDGRLLFRDHPQPMWIISRGEHRFLDVNEAAERLYGYSREEFLAMRLPDVAGMDGRHRTKDGRALEVAGVRREIDFHGQPAAICMLTDLTELRRIEDQLRQAQKMEAVGMLAGGIAHDFNNLLTIITGYSQLLLNSIPESDANHSSAAQIMKAGERAAALTRQLLAFSRREVIQPKILDLNHVVSGLSAMLRRLIGEDVELQLELAGDLGRVSADPGHIEQVIMNLAVNARDAMPRGGRLIIETHNVELDEHYAGTHPSTRPGPYVMLAVSDNGSGMTPETQARLFEPFFTTKGQGRGTGLGLTTVFGIVKQCGGNVEVYSQPGKGTSVKVYLPRIDQAASIDEAENASNGHRGHETILLVEDDEMVRMLVRETLQRGGYRVMDAADAAAAQKLSQKHRGEIQLLITDVVMPKVSGRELADIITRQRPGIKVLYMSGYTDNAIVNSGVLAREMTFIQKPFTPAALTRKVREVLEVDGQTRRAGG